MVDINDFYVAKTARYDEISALSRIYPLLFTTTDTVYLGDNSSLSLPDVYTKDFKKGFEIVTCEDETFYKEHNEYFCALNRDVNYDETFKNKNYILFKNLNLNNKMLFSTINKSGIIDYTKDEKAFYERLQNVTHKKLKNLNEGHYDGCKEVGLIIFSGFVTKPYINTKTILEVINTENKKFKNKFEYVYVICNNKILQISKFGEMQNITDNDFKTLYHKKQNSSMEK